MMLSRTGSAVRVLPIDRRVPDQWGPAGPMGMASGCALPGDCISSSSSSSCRGAAL